MMQLFLEKQNTMLSNKFDEVNSNFNEQNVKFNELSSNINEVNTRFNEVKSDIINEINERFHTIKKQMQNELTVNPIRMTIRTCKHLSGSLAP